jgi:hypothetical protein
MNPAPDEEFTSIEITADDLDPNNDQGEDTVGLTLTLPKAQAESWAREHEQELKDLHVDVVKANSDPVQPQRDD